MREGRRLGLIMLVDALLHLRGGDEGIVRHKKQFLGDVDGQLAHALRPAVELVKIDAKNAVDHILSRYGNMGPFVGHGGLLENGKRKVRQDISVLHRTCCIMPEENSGNKSLK